MIPRKMIVHETEKKSKVSRFCYTLRRPETHLLMLSLFGSQFQSKIHNNVLQKHFTLKTSQMRGKLQPTQTAAVAALWQIRTNTTKMFAA